MNGAACSANHIPCTYNDGMAANNVIYLPPGVVPPPANVPQPMIPSGVPFDRVFFERILPEAIRLFCQRAPCVSPRVEVLTVDGTMHYVKEISGVTDSWVALQTIKEDHDHPIQAFVPYQTIYRVEIHASEDERKSRLGFDLATSSPVETPAIMQPQIEAPAEKPKQRRASARKAARKE